MSERKRIAGRAQNEDVEKWLNSQSNLNTSLNNVISHMIRVFGYKNITDYEIQEFLFHKISSVPFNQDSDRKVSPKLHTIFIGSSATGKTTKLKELIMEEEEDFKIIISKHDEYLDEIKQLNEKGYKVVSANNGSLNELEFSEQWRIAFETSIEKNKVVKINTNETKNGFNPTLANDLFKKIFEYAQKHQLKVRFYIDDHVPFFNQLPKELIQLGRSYNCLVFAAFQTVEDIEVGIFRDFYLEDVKKIT